MVLGCDDPIEPLPGPQDTLTVTIGDRPLPDGIVGYAYNVALEARGGDGTYTWSVVSGQLPAGLNLDGFSVSGTSTVHGYFPILFEVESAGARDTATLAIRIFESQLMQELLGPLDNVIFGSLERMRNDISQNPGLATQFQAKIEMLSDPSLEGQIINGSMFDLSEFTNSQGEIVPLFVVFPRDSMRAGALQDRSLVSQTVGVLENFVQVSWPWPRVREWYGFSIGNSGGGGDLNMEDRGTYAERALPHDAILRHELAHSYIGHESLTQFLEVFAVNVIDTGTGDFAAWTYLRGNYVAFADSNTGAWALMDIYQLIGEAAMGRAYNAVYQINPLYGVPLSDAAKQVFVNEAPADVIQQVEAIVHKIVF